MTKQKIILILLFALCIIIILVLGLKYLAIQKELSQNQITKKLSQNQTNCENLKNNIKKNLFNGTGQGFKGGSQAYGGVEDYNVGFDGNGQVPQDTYVCPLGWTKCTSNNNYCDTGLSSADAKDNCTNLIWSLPCAGLGCVNFSNASSTYSQYSWDSSNINNNSLTASQLCSSGLHNQSGWFLPHQKQLIQAYINGSYGNLIPYGGMNPYWSATTNSWNQFNAWDVDLATGATYPEISKNDENRIRCVRPAN